MGDNFITSQRIVESLEIRSGDIIADFGAGHGFFAIDFAKKVGPSGQVFALDILPQALEAIHSRARLGGFFNISTIRADLERDHGSGLPDAKCDLVFCSNILFQVQDKSAVLKEAFRVLKPQGRLAVIEWQENFSLGPDKSLRISQEDLKKLVLQENFKELGAVDGGSHHYGFTFLKP